MLWGSSDQTTGEPTLRFSDIAAAIAVITDSGRIRAVTASAASLIEGAGVPARSPDACIPDEWLRQLHASPPGEPSVWTARGPSGVLRLGFARYGMRDGQWLLLLRDIGDREQALMQLLHQKRLEATGRLVASIVHDLRAPLSSLVLNASALSERIDDVHTDVHRVLEDLSAAADRIRLSIERLLDFARIGPPVREVLSIRHCIGGVHQLLGAMLREGGHLLTSQVPPDASEAIANRLVLEQIVVNLVLNSTEAARGRVRVEITSERVLPDRIALHIRDDGPGIAPEQMPMIFEPFFTTKARGTGLGLSTAREAARNLGGELSVRASDRGAHFVLELPAPEVPQ